MQVFYDFFGNMFEVLMNEAEQGKADDQDQKAFTGFKDRDNAQPSMVAWIRCAKSHVPRGK